jgi:hypothetical protein
MHELYGLRFAALVESGGPSGWEDLLVEAVRRVACRATAELECPDV